MATKFLISGDCHMMT